MFILNATFTNWNPRFDDIPRPERSQVVDFSKNENGKPFYDSSLMVYGKDNSRTFGERSIVWDDYLKSWTTHSDTGFDTNQHGKSDYNHFNYQQV